MPPVLLGLLVLPLVEIGVFVAVGSRIGILWTLLLVVAASLVGLLIVRRQSMSAFRTARAEARSGRVPDRAIVHGAMIVFAGFLLMLPGFVSDALALLLLLPPVRDLLWKRVSSRVVVAGGRRGPQRPPGARPGIVDLETDEFARRDGNPTSPWRGTISDRGTGEDRDPGDRR